jgi:hypothetical protein
MMSYSFWHGISTPPVPTRWWWVVSADGERLRPYRTQAAAKGQLRRWPEGSFIRQDP